jgi:hypothetical protein
MMLLLSLAGDWKGKYILSQFGVFARQINHDFFTKYFSRNTLKSVYARNKGFVDAVTKAHAGGMSGGGNKGLLSFAALLAGGSYILNVGLGNTDTLSSYVNFPEFSFFKSTAPIGLDGVPESYAAHGIIQPVKNVPEFRAAQELADYEKRVMDQYQHAFSARTANTVDLLAELKLLHGQVPAHSVEGAVLGEVCPQFRETADRQMKQKTLANTKRERQAAEVRHSINTIRAKNWLWDKPTKQELDELTKLPGIIEGYGKQISELEAYLGHVSPSCASSEFFFGHEGQGGVGQQVGNLLASTLFTAAEQQTLHSAFTTPESLHSIAEHSQSIVAPLRNQTEMLEGQITEAKGNVTRLVGAITGETDAIQPTKKELDSYIEKRSAVNAQIESITETLSKYAAEHLNKTNTKVVNEAEIKADKKKRGWDTLLPAVLRSDGTAQLNHHIEKLQREISDIDQRLPVLVRLMNETSSNITQRQDEVERLTGIINPLNTTYTEYITRVVSQGAELKLLYQSIEENENELKRLIEQIKISEEALRKFKTVQAIAAPNNTNSTEIAVRPTDLPILSSRRSVNSGFGATQSLGALVSSGTKVPSMPIGPKGHQISLSVPAGLPLGGSPEQAILDLSILAHTGVLQTGILGVVDTHTDLKWEEVVHQIDRNILVRDANNDLAGILSSSPYKAPPQSHITKFIRHYSLQIAAERYYNNTKAKMDVVRQQADSVTSEAARDSRDRMVGEIAQVYHSRFQHEGKESVETYHEAVRLHIERELNRLIIEFNSVPTKSGYAAIANVVYLERTGQNVPKLTRDKFNKKLHVHGSLLNHVTNKLSTMWLDFIVVAVGSMLIINLEVFNDWIVGCLRRQTDAAESAAARSARVENARAAAQIRDIQNPQTRVPSPRAPSPRGQRAPSPRGQRAPSPRAPRAPSPRAQRAPSPRGQASAGVLPTPGTRRSQVPHNLLTLAALVAAAPRMPASQRTLNALVNVAQNQTQPGSEVTSAATSANSQRTQPEGGGTRKIARNSTHKRT